MAKRELSLFHSLLIFLDRKKTAPGTLVLAFGMFFFVIFSFSIDFEFYHYAIKETIEAKGVVTQIEPTSAGVNGRNVMKYSFTYEALSQTMSGASYSSTQSFTKGQEVIVELVKDEPQHARILNTSNAPFGISSIFVVLIFPGLGLTLVLIELVKTIKIAKLFVKAEIEVGKRVLMDGTWTKVENKTLYKLEYAFSVAGSEYTHSFKTTDPNYYDEEENVLYDPHKPSDSFLLRRLPVKIQQLTNNSSHDQLWE